jgi:two-component system, NarL family, response regulator DevR
MSPGSSAAAPLGDGPIGVFVVDDHELIRRGLRELLGAEQDLTVVGEAATVREALEGVETSRPDVVLLDLRLPDGDGAEVCRSVVSAHPEVHCVVLTSFADDREIMDVLQAGATGYVMKSARTGDILKAIHEAVAGRSMIDPTITGRLLDRIRGPEADPLALLTPQERRVLALVAEGHSNREIASRLGLAEKTVKNHVSNLLAKLNLDNRTEAALFGARALHGI